MKKDNKIISFDSSANKRKNDNYVLTAEISVYICRDIETYTDNWHSSDNTISEEEIYSILKSIFLRLIPKIPTIQIKEIDSYEVTFTLFYYENPNKDDFRFVCTPQNISDEKLLEYLFTLLSNYELKEI